MTWLMPAELVPLAGLLALLAARPRLQQSRSHGRIVFEILIIRPSTIVALAMARALY